MLRSGVWTLLLVGTVSPALACSMVPSYMELQLDAASRPQTALLPPPSVTVQEIRRGRTGEAGMCADLGFLVLRIPDEIRGYKFEVVEGMFPASTFPVSAFPKGFVQPRTGGWLSFSWVDGALDEQEPINIVVKITSISLAGVPSEPLYLRIEDPGRVADR